jgi:ribosomal protein S18 acetylase RimI-like enzyme
MEKIGPISKKNPLGGEIEMVFAAAFPDIDHREPVLGATDDIVISSSLRAFITDSRSMITVLRDEHLFVGANVAIPADVMDPARTDAPDTAYIYYTGIVPEYQGKNLVKTLMADTFEFLKVSGYRYVEEDCVESNGYAAKVQKVYADSIVESRAHEGFTGLGPQVFFRIALRGL